MATAVNPQTGEVLELKNGQWVPQQSQGGQRSATGGSFTTPELGSVRSNILGDPLADYNVDRDTGAPFGVRAGVGVKMTSEGKTSYLESKYGKGNVATRADGSIAYFNPETKKWTLADEGGVRWGDVADLSGAAIETAPAVAAGLLSGNNPLAVGGGAGAGNVLRQGVSGLLPGDDQMGMGERVTRPLVSAGLGFATQFGVNKLTGVQDALRPHNIVARSVQKSQQTPFAKRGELLAREMGDDFAFSPGQLSGNRGQLMVEGLARQHPASADKVMQFDTRQAQTAVKRLNKLLTSIDDRGMGGIQTGQKVAETFKQATRQAVNARSKQAAADFGRVQELAGNNPVLDPNNVRATIKGLIDDFDVPGGGDATATLVSRLRGVASELDKPLTAQQTQRLLQVYGNAAKGTGQLFKDIDSAQQRMVAGRVFGALLDDLDDAASAGGQGGAVAEALKLARDNYRANSAQIDDLGNSVLGRLFNGKYEQAPEAIADKFLKMRPSEIKAATEVLASQDPGTVQAVKRHMLQSAMDSAIPSASGTNAAGVMFSPAKFNSFIQKNADQFRAAFSPKEVVQVKRIYEGLQRVVDRAGMQGSQTGPLLMALDVAKGAFTMSPTSVARSGVAVLAPRHIATAMTTEQGRKALITLTQTSAGAKARRAAAVYLSGVLARDEMNAENVRPLAPEQAEQAGQL